MFISACDTGTLGYLISSPKALRLLLSYKLRDVKFQFFLLKWAGALLAILGGAVCGFKLMPMFLALGVVVQGVCLSLLLLWLSADTIFLKFALEDEEFYKVATLSHALDVFEDTEYSLPQPAECHSPLSPPRPITPPFLKSSGVEGVKRQEPTLRQP